MHYYFSCLLCYYFTNNVCFTIRKCTEGEMNRCAPQFLRPLSGMMEVGEGEAILLEVRVHGRPLPEVEWFRNGEEIQKGYSSDHGHHELRIPRVTQHHTGEYRCSAVNASGRVSSALWVAVVPSKGGIKNSQSVGYNKESIPQNQGFYFENPLSRNATSKVVNRTTKSEQIYDLQRTGRAMSLQPKNRDGENVGTTSPRRRK